MEKAVDTWGEKEHLEGYRELILKYEGTGVTAGRPNPMVWYQYWTAAGMCPLSATF